MRALVGILLAAALAGAGAEEKPACLKSAAWTALEREPFRAVGGNALLSEMARRDVVLLGEQHTETDHHQWQLQTLSALHALRPDMVIGFEVFPRRAQPALDRWVAGELTVREFLDQSGWNKFWSAPPELYLPLFQFARINRIRMVALNVDEKLTKAIAAKGWDAIPPAEREGVGRPVPPVEAYRDMLFEVYREHATMHGAKKAEPRKTDPAFRYFIESQTTWDRAMAEALAGAAAGKSLVVGIIGSGHLRFGHGVPHQLRSLGVQSIGTLLPLDADTECTNLRAGMADAVFTLPQQAQVKPEPPRLGVRLEQNEGTVSIADVTAGSLAERSGLRAGDRLMEVGGSPATRIAPVIATVRQQPDGSWLPMRIKRGEETLELVIKFPAKP
jgi:uncharacterized iron-regulated protein